MNLMEITQLNTSVKVFESGSDALESFPVPVAAYPEGGRIKKPGGSSLQLCS
jgi:hypothetical protein